MIDYPLSKTARQILEKRCLRKGENVESMFRRVAKTIAQGDSDKSERYFHLLSSRKFLPSSPFLVNAGYNNSMMSCFVLPLKDDNHVIFDTMADMCRVQQGYGGTGFDFSPIRPRGDKLSTNDLGQAIGPIGYMKMYSHVADTIKQGSNRSGAMMAVLRCDHPDIMEFITCKQDEGVLANFNISVGITDEFMAAVKANDTWALINPRDGSTTRTMFARELWDAIAENAHRNGEPGLLFLDTINNIDQHEIIHATNPCFAYDQFLFTTGGQMTYHELEEDEEELPKCDNWGHYVETDPRFRDFNFKYYRTSYVYPTHKNAEVFELKTKRGYSIRTTANHEFYKKTKNGHEKVPLSELKLRDRVAIFMADPNKKYQNQSVGKFGTKELGYLLGAIFGNPEEFIKESSQEFEKTKICEPRLVFAINRTTVNLRQSTKREIKMFNRLHKAVRKIMKQAMEAGKAYEHIQPGAVFPESKRKFYCYDLLRLLDQEYGIDFHDLTKWPLSFNRCRWSFWKYFFESFLFYSGVYLKEKNTIRISSQNEDLMKNIQRVLVEYGIVCSYSEEKLRRKKAYGRNYIMKRRTCHLDFEKQMAAKFIQKFEFPERLMFEFKVRGKSLMHEHPEEMFNDEIVSIESQGEEPVWCCRQANGNTLVVNGFPVGNCGESPLLPYESCCLGSLVLPNYVIWDTKEEDYTIDFANLAADAKTAATFLNDSYDVNNFPLEQIEKQSKKYRKLGLGVMGFADMLIEMGIRYGSEESLKIAGLVMNTIREAARVACNGNSAHTSIAPTGSIAIIAGVSNGIEPNFSFVQKRNIEVGSFFEVHPKLEDIVRDLQEDYDENEYEEKIEQIFKDGHVRNVLPERYHEYFVCASDISKEEHVAVQAEFQKYTDLGVSKTINLPQEASIDDVKECYRLAHEGKCKGVTIYRDKSRESQVLEKGTNETEESGNCNDCKTFRPCIECDEQYDCEYSVEGDGCCLHSGCDYPRHPVASDEARICEDFDPKDSDKSEFNLTYSSDMKNWTSSDNTKQDTEWTNLTTEEPEVKTSGYAEVTEKKKHISRPKEMSGKTFKCRCQGGVFYIVVNVDEAGYPREVFAMPNSKSKDVEEIAESLCRITSLALRNGVAVDEIITQFKKIRRLSMVGLTHHLAESLEKMAPKDGWKWVQAGAWAKADKDCSVNIQLHMGSSDGKNIKGIVDQVEIKNLDNGITNFETEELCPDCEQKLIAGGGCMQCNNCGYSKCGG